MHRSFQRKILLALFQLMSMAITACLLPPEISVWLVFLTSSTGGEHISDVRIKKEERHEKSKSKVRSATGMGKMQEKGSGWTHRNSSPGSLPISLTRARSRCRIMASTPMQSFV